MMKHCDQVVSLLRKQIGNAEEVAEIYEAASKVAARWIDPLSGGKGEINGLIYGLVQSGKTGVLTVTGAIGADEGYRTLLVLTSDNDPLYEQTLARVREAFPGIDIIGKKEFRDRDAFIQRIRSGTCAIVTTKNGAMLKTLIDNFTSRRIRGLSCLIIDDEADQASLNTRASKKDGSRSTINARISELRDFFERNTYLQVTATPQSLFLQAPGHAFRPKFTVLSHPGAEYVGGDDFFRENSPLTVEFDSRDLVALTPGAQPSPRLELPRSLLRALDTFMVGATFKRTTDPDGNCAFLCHVSTRTSDHNHIVDLLRAYKSELASGLRRKDAKVVGRLKAVFDDLGRTHEGIRASRFVALIEAIEFLAPGITVKLVNGETDEDVAVRSPFNLFVGGNKLGRGVTIKNLLVSYYGRNPRRPQADTVLQHARMYGYRRKDYGLLRLFLPPELNTVFRAIYQMERSLRDLIERSPGEEFRGIYIESGIGATRRNVLVPGAIGVYTGGSIYNPAQVVRDATVLSHTKRIDELVAGLHERQPVEVSTSLLRKLISETLPDQSQSERVWDALAVSESIVQFALLHGHTTGYLYIDRERGLKQRRRETQGILEGGEAGHVPADKITLFLLRTIPEESVNASWWPQVRFPSGQYAFAFAV